MYVKITTNAKNFATQFGQNMVPNASLHFYSRALRPLSYILSRPPARPSTFIDAVASALLYCLGALPLIVPLLL